MTLVLSLITDDFIIHASDRRLTDGRTGRQVTTKAAKTVICPPSMVMVSFTGLAKIAPPMETGEWLMRTLWANKHKELFGSLARAADKAFAAISIPPALRRHAFLVSGWLHHGMMDPPLPPGFKVGPYTTLVSNFDDPAWSSGRPSDSDLSFRHSTRALLLNQSFVIDSVGAQLTDTERTTLDRHVSAALRSKTGGRERAAALLMAQTIRSVSERDPTVGGGVFIAALPRHIEVRAPQPKTMEILGVRWGLPEPETATFVHIPDVPTTVVETPYILGDPFAGIGILKVDGGPVPDLKPLAGIPKAGEMKINLISWYSADELAQRFGGRAPTPPWEDDSKS